MTDRIGEFLVKVGTMKPWQVQAVLQAQAHGGVRRFGEIAIELGFVQDDAIKRYVDYLEKQPRGD